MPFGEIAAFSAREAEKDFVGWQNFRKQNEHNPALLNFDLKGARIEVTFYRTCKEIYECMTREEHKTPTANESGP